MYNDIRHIFIKEYKDCIKFKRLNL